MIGILIGTTIILGTGIGLWCLGRWIGAQKDRPIGFWANGKPLEAKSVSDIPGYNRDYGKLFCIFSVPASCSGFLMCLSLIYESFAIASCILLMLWGSIGLIWLIVSYKKIEKQYIFR